MPRQTHLAPKFIDLAPPELKEGVLDVSMVYGSVIHKPRSSIEQSRAKLLPNLVSEHIFNAERLG
jgi:hypothetical protein